MRFVVVPVLVIMSLSNHRSSADAEPATDLNGRALAELNRALIEESEFIKVHAAETLLTLGHSQNHVRAVFEQEASKYGTKAIYRVGIWRVLARAGKSMERRREMTQRLRDTFLDTSVPDQIHAVESLAKLNYVIPTDERPAFEAAAKSDNSGLTLFANWVLTQSAVQPQPYRNRIAMYLDAEDPIARLRAAYILSHAPKLTMENRRKLKDTAQREPTDTMTYAYVVGASFVVAGASSDEDELSRCRAELSRIARSGELREQYAACEAFARCGTISDLPLLTDLLKDDESDVRVAAAFAILQIGRRSRDNE